MSERYPKHLESSARMRSSEEQRRLMDEFETAETARYNEGLDEEAFNEKMAEREREAIATVEARILENPEANRMYMMAQHIAELRANGGDTSDKEDKLQELLEDYTEKARAVRDTKVKNAEMERDTPKGREIRRSKEIEAEEEFEQRQEEVDFIINSTDEAWTNEKMGKAKAEAEIDPDIKTATEITEALKNNPELAEDPRVREELEALRRALNGEPEPRMEPFNNKDVVVAGGEMPRKDSVERPEFDAEEAEPALVKDDAERPEFDDVAEEGEKPVKDDVERPRFDDDDDPADRTPEDVLRESLRAGFGENPIPEVYDELEEEEAPRGRFNWAKRAYARAGVFFSNTMERLRGMDRRKKVGLGIGVVALAGVAAYAAFKLGHHDHHHPTGSGSGGDQTPENPAGEMKADYDAKRNAAEAAGNAFSHEALTIDPGEGWLHELHNLNIPSDEAQSLLPKILKSHDRGIRAWTYLMQDGNPGISHPGKIPPSVLESIEELRNQ